MKIKLKPLWKKFFLDNKEEVNEIINSLDYENETILPKKEQIFRTFQYCDVNNIKLVLLGQDPYPSGKKEKDMYHYYAEGLSFSVNPEIKTLPGSLRNIFTELKDCYPEFTYKNGSLEKWLTQEKILLLNTSLTVKEGKPNSHKHLWKDFTDKVIEYLDKNSNCLFLLMGNDAKSKEKLIQNKNRIITCVHPSPLSAHKGFLGSKIFIKINEKLKENNIKEINWCNL